MQVLTSRLKFSRDRIKKMTRHSEINQIQPTRNVNWWSCIPKALGTWRSRSDMKLGWNERVIRAHTILQTWMLRPRKKRTLQQLVLVQDIPSHLKQGGEGAKVTKTKTKSVWYGGETFQFSRLIGQISLNNFPNRSRENTFHKWHPH